MAGKTKTTVWSRPGLVALLLFALLVAVYVGNFRLRGAGDSFPTRVLPFSILREGDLDLDEFTWERSADGRLPYYVFKSGRHIYSVSPIATSIVMTPLYALPAWYLAAYDIPYDDVRARVLIVAAERFCAAVMTALSAALLFLLLCGLVSRHWALGLTLIYALGTSTWAISSQALWAHALSELALVVLCGVLMRPEPARWAVVLAGVTAAVSVANRPPMLIFAGLALAFVFIYHRRHLLAFVAAPVVVAVLLVAYNTSVVGGILGGYKGLYFSAPLVEGVAGLLFSPNRGLFVYTPITLFAFWGAVQVWRLEGVHPWLKFLAVGLTLHVALYAKFDEWWAGYTYGPRYMTDVLPVLALLLVYGLVPLCRSRPVRVLAAALAIYGVAVQAIGVYSADDGWNREPVPLEQNPQRVWDWSDLQIVRALRGGWRGAELLPVMIDSFRDPVPARLVALSPADLASELRIVSAPARLAPGEAATVVVRVGNRAAKPWPAFSGKGVLSARYLTYVVQLWLVGGERVPGLGEVVPLPENLAPGETVQVRLPMIAPPVPGAYEVELRVTQAVDGRRGIPSPDALRFAVQVAD